MTAPTFRFLGIETVDGYITAEQLRHNREADAQRDKERDDALRGVEAQPLCACHRGLRRSLLERVYVLVRNRIFASVVDQRRHAADRIHPDNAP